MSLAETCLERMASLKISVAQAHNDLATDSGADFVDEVDGMYKFYHFRDGSKLGCLYRVEPHAPRLPVSEQQVWIVR